MISLGLQIDLICYKVYANQKHAHIKANSCEVRMTKNTYNANTYTHILLLNKVKYENLWRKKN